ncbi:MAG: hypothetical protein AAF694_10280 [Bacteroidota bacterium]
MASLIIPIKTYSMLVRPRQVIERIINIKGEPNTKGVAASASLYFYTDAQLPTKFGRVIRINPTTQIGSHATVFLPASSFGEVYHVIQTEHPINIYLAFETTSEPNATADVSFFQMYTKDENPGEGPQDPDMAAQLEVPV